MCSCFDFGFCVIENDLFVIVVWFCIWFCVWFCFIVRKSMVGEVDGVFLKDNVCFVKLNSCIIENLFKLF